MIKRPEHGRVEVRCLCRQWVIPIRLDHGVPRLLVRVRELHEVVHMAPMRGGRSFPPSIGQALEGVRPHQLVDLIASIPKSVGQPLEKRAFPQRRQGVRLAPVTASGASRVNPPTKTARPVNTKRSSSLSHCQDPSRTARMLRLPVGEAGSSACSWSIHRSLDAGQQVARREYPDPARDQLDGQRQAIDLPADPANHLGVGWSDGVARSKHRRPVDEEVGCISLTQRAVHVDAQRWNGVYLLYFHLKWSTARRQHPQTRTTGQ